MIATSNSKAETQELGDRCEPDAADGPYKLSLKFAHSEARLPRDFPFETEQSEIKEMLSAPGVLMSHE
jgi:hypothetical protein